MADKDIHVSCPKSGRWLGWNEWEVPSRVREELVFDVETFLPIAFEDSLNV